MIDNFEHDKPYSLTAHYLKDAEPSQLTVSYDLHATFLGVPDTGLPVTQYVNALSFLSQEFGIGNLVFTQHVRTTGFGSLNIPNPKIHNLTQSIRATGLNASLFGTAQLKNKNQTSGAVGFNASLYGRPTIYNLRQYLRFGGMHTAVFGTAYMQGGVKYVRATGFNVLAFPTPKVINTRADQYVDLRTPSRGIAPPAIDRPNVSPQILYPKGVLAWSFGTPWVQRNPSPKGFVTDSYGTAWVSHSPRYLKPDFVKAFESGYAKVFDPTQKVGVSGVNTVIAGGIFGDIAIRNKLRFIRVNGSDQSEYGNWSSIFSNLIVVHAQSFDHALFGNNVIFNKTPSLIPKPWDSVDFGDGLIAYRNRQLRVVGFGSTESTRFGKHVFSKPPEINLRGFSPMVFGQPSISNKVRTIFAGASNHLRMGSDLMVWFRYRYVELESKGIYSQAFASPKIEHGLRTLLQKGSDLSRVATPTVWFKVRSVLATSIYREFETNHIVGGTQFIKPDGYIASLFGERIVPENQGVYGTGFNAQGFTENHRIELYTRWVRATGFLTFGIQTSDRYGTAYIWNKRQYIQHNYDSGDGLNPGDFGQWTTITNRNREIKAIGYDASRQGYTQTDNKARPLITKGITHTAIGNVMIADRVRHLKPDGMESPYLTGWGRIFNSAFVISPDSSKHDQWGRPAVINTRREYRWVGAFESLEFGNPMIAFKIRNIHIETRYGINPPHIPIHRVDLYTRYVDIVGDDLNHFGGINLHIKWNKITPRWFHQEKFGEPRVWNLTPELRQRGNVTEEFGQSKIFLYRRDIFIDGYRTELFGKTSIAYRDRSMRLVGANYMFFGVHKVIRTGAPPYSLQNISLDWAGEGDRPDDYEGLGIELPKGQVSTPSLRTNVIFAEGFVATIFGNNHAQSNGILLDAGIQEFAIGEHNVILKNRTIEVPTLGDFGDNIRDTKPRLSPHTIYAVMDAPAQAIRNHPVSNLHYVNSSSGGRTAGEIFGRTSISLQHRTIRLQGLGTNNFVPTSHAIQLAKRYIEPTAIRSLRMGYHTLGPFDISVDQYDSTDMALYGRANVSHVVDLNKRYLRPTGMLSQLFGNHRVEFFHRNIYPRGTDTLLMGTRRSNDKPFMWQGLRVGELIKGVYGGFESLGFGDTWASLKVRDIQVEGFETFALGYDHTQFNERMKVVLKPKDKPKQYIGVSGFENTLYGVFNIKPKAHYIHPDGNSDQYRKGGF